MLILIIIQWQPDTPNHTKSPFSSSLSSLSLICLVGKVKQHYSPSSSADGSSTVILIWSLRRGRSPNHKLHSSSCPLNFLNTEILNSWNSFLCFPTYCQVYTPKPTFLNLNKPILLILFLLLTWLQPLYIWDMNIQNTKVQVMK